MSLKNSRATWNVIAQNQWRPDYRAVTRMASPFFTVPSGDLPVFNLASYGLVHGQPGLQKLA
jgi:hypothetical protein